MTNVEFHLSMNNSNTDLHINANLHINISIYRIFEANQKNFSRNCLAILITMYLITSNADADTKTNCNGEKTVSVVLFTYFMLGPLTF